MTEPRKYVIERDDYRGGTARHEVLAYSDEEAARTYAREHPGTEFKVRPALGKLDRIRAIVQRSRVDGDSGRALALIEEVLGEL